MKYSLETLIEKLNPQRKQLVKKILHKFQDTFDLLPGAQTKHQNWKGGYRDHVEEVMNIAVLLFNNLDLKRKLPFILEDALFILFLHDMDKLISYKKTDNGYKRTMSYEEAQKKVRELIRDMHYELSESEMNALDYVHGEVKDYHPTVRIMNELATFVHCCDIISSRIWYSYGQDNKNW